MPEMALNRRASLQPDGIRLPASGRPNVVSRLTVIIGRLFGPIDSTGDGEESTHLCFFMRVRVVSSASTLTQPDAEHQEH